MHVYHLNCGTQYPYSARLVNGTGTILSSGCLVGHCLLIETQHGLILVDTGFGLKDIADPTRPGRAFVVVARPRLDPEETAVRHVTRLGFKTQDVRHIVLTHLDMDHAGGLADFPEAQVHLFAQEHEAAMRPTTFPERQRYRTALWAHRPKWVIHSLQGEQWYGFDCVHVITNDQTEVLLVPLPGHTRGHCGVAVRTPDGWLLHCGDAYLFRGEMSVDHPHSTLGLEWFQRSVQVDREARLRNRARLRALVRDHDDEVRVFCAHDPVEFSRFRDID